MSTFNIKSTLITNRDASPPVLTDAQVAGASVKSAEGYVQTNGAADGAGSIYRMVQVPSNARIEAVKLAADALGSGCTLSVGVFWPTYIPAGSGLSTANQSAVINTQLFAAALGCSAATAITDITNQSTNNTIVKQELPLWSAAGLTSDPGIDLDICVYVSAAVATQGYIGLKVAYVL